MVLAGEAREAAANLLKLAKQAAMTPYAAHVSADLTPFAVQPSTTTSVQDSLFRADSAREAVPAREEERGVVLVPAADKTAEERAIVIRPA